MGFYYAPYVPVAVRREKALKKMTKLSKKGLKIQPIELTGRKIVSNFWGKAWCEHIESFSDYDNRLPRGKRYVRNGSVCHLAIEKGEIKAMVSGSSIYNVTVKIAALSTRKWATVKKNCSGKIASLLELLSGQLSNGVMQAVCDDTAGLFPTAKEIDYSCSCPDYASLCKHIAAVLYGVGSRLDVEPQQLFNLRGVNHEELIDVSASIAKVTKAGKSKRRRIADDSIAKVFAVDLAEEQPKKRASRTKKSAAKRTSQAKKVKKTKTAKATAKKTKAAAVKRVKKVAAQRRKKKS